MFEHILIINYLQYNKIFGQKVFGSANENANMVLIKLSKLFNHSNVPVTRIYLGIREENC